MHSKPGMSMESRIWRVQLELVGARAKDEECYDDLDFRAFDEGCDYWVGRDCASTIAIGAEINVDLSLHNRSVASFAALMDRCPDACGLCPFDNSGQLGLTDH